MPTLKPLTTLFLFLGSTLSAQTHVVTTSDDYVTGSLRHWVTNSSANDTIVFDPSILANGSDTIKVDFPIIFNHGLMIKGLFLGSDTLYISGQDSSRIFYMDFDGVSGVEMYLEDLAIIEGNQYVSDALDYKTNGGAIMAYELSVFEVKNSVIRDNQVKNRGRGGAFFIWQTPQIVIENCLVQGNHTADSISFHGGQGGAFYFNNALSGGTILISNSKFIKNSSYSAGGSVFVSGAELEMRWCTFVSNRVLNGSYSLQYSGGALDFGSNGDGKIENCVFEDNASLVGGALSLTSSGNLEVNQCVFNNNYSYYDAGAVWISSANPLSSTFSNCTFNGNSSNNSGALKIDIGSSTPQLVKNATFFSNKSSDGNAIYISQGTATVLNNTIIAGDSATNSPLVAFSSTSSNSSVTISNSILSHNSNNPTHTDPSLWTSTGHNIFSDNPSFSVGTDQVNVSNTTLDLEPHGNYGGLTPTMPPMSTSPAYNAGNPSDLSNAQNSPIYGIRDIGAAERQMISTDTSLVCGPITWWGNNYSQAGTYTDSAYNAMGTLDSTGVLVLTEINDSATVKNPYIVALEQSIGTTYQWIDCNNPLVTLTGATDSIYQPTTNGTYAVIISLGGCVDTSNCVLYNQVSLDENVLPEQWMTFYPNPTNGSITVRGLDKNSLPLSLIIMDLSGRPLHEMTITSERIQLPPLAEGMYLLKFIGEKAQVQVERVVIRE